MNNLIVGNAALLIIDMQHDFLEIDGPVLCPTGRQIIPALQQLATVARQADVPVIYTQEVHRPTKIDFGRELDGEEGLHCVDGTRGVQIVPELAPGQGDILVRKPRYSAFLGTDLPFVLNGIGVRPGDTLIVTGVATDVCIHYTCADAHQRDYRVRVPVDCVAGTDSEAHTASLRAIKYLQAHSLTNLKEMLAALAAYVHG
ncbi:MAG: cysteine hydrolase [Chloroflexi bacterium]|nr:cysteine hydrolase [Chloroflexota bacterium]